VPCLRPRYRGKALASRVSDAKASLGTGDVGAARGASVASGTSGNFATHFTTLSKALTTSLLAFT
jgi:hypothetical protein